LLKRSRHLLLLETESDYRDFRLQQRPNESIERQRNRAAIESTLQDIFGDDYEPPEEQPHE